MEHDGAVLHERCGFPLVPDGSGNWCHASAREELACELIGGGGMLAPLTDEEED